MIEIFASAVVIWQLRGVHLNCQRTALRLIGAAFFALAVYVLVQSAAILISGARPGTSLGGIVWLALTLVAMLALALGKARTGRALGNAVLQTEARLTVVDAYLAGAVLLGLVLDAALGWWWSDPLAGLVIVYYGAKEGRHAWHEAGRLLWADLYPRGSAKEGRHAWHEAAQLERLPCGLV